MHTIQDIKDCEEGGSLYIYRTLEGVPGSAEDPVIGKNASISVLRQETDFTPQRKHPFVGDRIDCYQVKDGQVVTFASDWVVYHVEAFPGTGLIKEVVIAWCRKEPLSTLPRISVVENAEERKGTKQGQQWGFSEKA